MFDKLDDCLVDGWRCAWRMWSLWMHTIGTTLGALLLIVPAMPKEMQELIPLHWRAIAVAVWFALGLWARLAKQRKDTAGGK